MTVSHNPEETSRRRLVLGIAALVVALGVAGVIIAVAVGGSRKTTPAEEPKTFEPAQPTTAAPLPGAVASANATPGVPRPGASSGATVTSGSGVRAPKIAFRLGATIYVAAEDGSNSVAIVQAPDGPYALSPDGNRLAYVAAGALRIVDVATKKAVEAGPAIDKRPAWSADSKTVYAVRSAGAGSEVFSVTADGGRAKRVAAGGLVAVAPDADIVVIGPEEAASGSAAKQVLVMRSGKAAAAVSAPAAVTGVGITASRLYVGTLDDAGAVTVWQMALDGSAREAIATPAEVGKPTPVTVLMPSPDGRWVVFSVTGDDGYSRTTSQRVPSGQSAPISVRRDTYPMSFSADGKWLFFIEGNAWQGEQTALKRARPDGIGRVTVVSGAEP